MKKRVFAAVFLVVFLTSLASAMMINVTSPIEGAYYNSSSVSISASSNEAVRWKTYIDVSILGPSSNIEKTDFTDKTLDLLDGAHTLIISTTNSTTSINSSTVTFYVDTTPPVINSQSQTPANNSTVPRENVGFSVSYTEANLNYTKIYWRSQSDSPYNETTLLSTDCGSVSCSKTIDFSSLSYGTNISYYFNLTDKTSKSNSISVYTFRLCTPYWNCTEWGACSGGTKTKNCTDLNSCGIGTNKPSENETCSSCTPNWVLGDWSSCSGGTQTRTYTDSNNCGTTSGKPSDESQSCSETQTNEDTSNENTEIQNINYFLSESQIGNGSLRTLKLAGDKISFKIKNESHVLELRKIFSDKVSIKISSVEQYANLSLNEVKKFDLTADRYYDVLVILKRLTSSEADILINATNEKVPITVTTNINVGNTSGGAGNLTSNTASEAGEAETANETESFGSRITGGFLGAFENMKQAPIYLLVIFGVVIVGLVGTTIFMILRKKKKKRWGRK